MLITNEDKVLHNKASGEVNQIKFLFMELIIVEIVRILDISC